MIRINRLLAHHIASVFPSVLGLSGPAVDDYPVELEAGPAGLWLRAVSQQAAVQFHATLSRHSARLVVPLAAFLAVAADKLTTVGLEHALDHRIVARWEERQRPSIASWPIPDASNLPLFPVPDHAYVANPPRLLAALRDVCAAARSEKPSPVLSSFEIKARQGAVAAMSGGQRLIRSGFQFGFQEDLRVHAIQGLGYANLHLPRLVEVSKSQNHFFVRSGPWTFALRLERTARCPIVSLDGEGSEIRHVQAF